MDGQDHARALGALQTGIVRADRLIERLVWIKSHFVLDIATPLRVDVVTVARRIDLYVVHSLIHQRLNLRLDDWNDIPEESRIARIDFVTDPLLVVDRGKLIGSGQRDFNIPGAMLLHEGQLVLGQAPGLLYLAHDDSRHSRGARRAPRAALPSTKEVVTLVEPLDSFVEVTHKVMATQLPVSKYSEAKVLLALQHSQNVFIFQRPQLLAIHRSPSTKLLQILWTQ